MDQLEKEAEALRTKDSSGDGSVAPSQEAEVVTEAGEFMEAPDPLLSLLSLSAELPSSSTATPNGTIEAASTAAAAARQRALDQVKLLFGQLLKSVANSPACGAAVWGLYARWHRLQGQLLSSQEAWLKQVGEG